MKNKTSIESEVPAEAEEKKETDKYYFSVEGETEKWYLEWLEEQINACESAKRKVSFNTKRTDPKKRVKSLSIVSPVEICHVFDVEEEAKIGEFRTTLQNIKEASNLGKDATFINGYSNYTFELWLLLHKRNMDHALSHRKDYLEYINKDFNEKFTSLKHAKEEKNFKGMLKKLSLNDVKTAIARAKKIDENNSAMQTCCEHCGYRYYKDNPATDLWIQIDKIMTTAGV